MITQINNLNHYNVSSAKMEENLLESPQKHSSDGYTQSKENAKENKIVAQESRIDKLMSIYGEKVLKQMGIIDCESCKSRTYVDGSDDPAVSFKTPTNISPESSEAAVAAHEGEHVANETAKAESEGREVVSQSVRTYKEICPECGKMYTSGGVTKTTTQNKSKYEAQIQNFEGQLLDMTI